MVFIFLVFCVVVFGGHGVRGAHPFSFLCCEYLVCSVLFIFLVFCVVVFGGGSVVLIFLVLSVVVFGGARGAHLF